MDTKNNSVQTIFAGEGYIKEEHEKSNKIIVEFFELIRKETKLTEEFNKLKRDIFSICPNEEIFKLDELSNELEQLKNIINEKQKMIEQHPPLLWNFYSSQAKFIRQFRENTNPNEVVKFFARAEVDSEKRYVDCYFTIESKDKIIKKSLSDFRVFTAYDVVFKNKIFKRAEFFADLWNNWCKRNAYQMSFYK